jgi:hypothetical protein
MAKTRNPKNPEHRYFSIDAIAELDEPSAPYAGFVTSYATYVITRLKSFTARYARVWKRLAVIVLPHLKVL